MTKSIRLLALNDDNHETFFISETGMKFHTHFQLIKFLADPHGDWGYDVRCVYLLDIDECDEVLTTDFDILQGLINVSLEQFDESFNRLWEISKETMFGGY